MVWYEWIVVAVAGVFCLCWIMAVAAMLFLPEPSPPSPREMDEWAREQGYCEDDETNPEKED